MISMPSTYQNHWRDPDAWIEWKLDLYDGSDHKLMTANADAIKSLGYTAMLSDEEGIPIGGVCAERWNTMVELAECEPDAGAFGARSWPKSATAMARFRLHYGDGLTTAWRSRGKFKAASRPKTHDGILTVSGYNGMMEMDDTWINKLSNPPQSWPITSRAAANLIAEALGCTSPVGFSSLLDNSVPLIPFDTALTAREALATIAAANGGNFQMRFSLRNTGASSPQQCNNALYFIPLRSVNAGTSAVAGLAVAGVAVVGTASPVEMTYVGTDLAEFELGDPFPAVSGVELTADDGRVAYAGDDTGYILRAACNAYDMDAAAALCLSKVRGFVYRPFTGGTVWLDPAADVGDLVTIDGTAYQMGTISWTLGPHPCCDLEAPFTDEVEEQNPQQSDVKKALRLALNAATQGDMREVYSYIRQSLDLIELAVGEKVGEDEIISKINMSTEAVSISGSKVDLEGKELTFKVGDDGKISFIANGVTLASFHMTNIQDLGQSAALDGTLPIYIASHGNDIELVAYSSPSNTVKKYASLYIDNDGAMTFKTYTATYYPESDIWIEGNLTEVTLSDSAGLQLKLSDGTSGTVSTALINGHVVLVLT